MTAGHKSYTLAADNEHELRDWLTKLSSVIQQNKIQEEKRAASLERGNLIQSKSYRAKTRQQIENL